MEKESKEDITDMPFYPIMVGENNYNINRVVDENFCLLSDFSDATPLFDPKYGPYLSIKSKDGKVTKQIQLMAPKMLIKDADKMSRDEYYKILMDKKKEFVNKYIIKQTFVMGYEYPSPIQSLAVLEMIQGRDVLIQSKSGTGKTHAFLFGCLWHFDPMDTALQHIFVTSSHEVAIQTFQKARILLPETTKIALCIGQKKDTASTSTGGFKTPIGTSSLTVKQKTLKEEREEVSSSQVIVCTMGKFYDFLCNKKYISLKYLKSICIDEFDNIVSSRSKSRSTTIMNTEDQMVAIMNEITNNAKRNKYPDAVQRIFCSATVSKESLEIACNYFRPYNKDVGEPFIVLLDIEDYTLEGIRQYYVICEKYDQKKEILLDLIKQCRIAQAIIFTNRIETANDIKLYLDEQEIPFSSAVFHGGLPSVVRSNIHKDFIDNKIRLLISTDVTARGLDIHSINLVILFDMPEHLETYIHRIGRSGRFGRKGVAISFILVSSKMDERKKLDSINECSKNSKIEELPKDLENLL